MALPVSRLVNVQLNLSPLAAQVRSFGSLLICGDSNVINGLDRIRSYDSFEGVETDFGTEAPETLAAELYFGQTPSPQKLYIGRWLRVASAGLNIGGILTPTEQLLATWTAITTGAFKITIDGVLKSPTAMDFSTQTNLNGVASIITTALSGAVCTWNGEQFTITSPTTGTMSSVSAAIAPSAGTDISTMLQLTAPTLTELVPGYASETPVQCAAVMANLSPDWYGLMFQASVQPADADNLNVAAFIEALDLKRIFGVTIVNTNVLNSSVSNDLASELMAGGYLQSFCQYSQNAYAIASFFGRAFTVDYTASNSTINLMYKQEPGVTAEDLTSSQADTLQSKRCNVYAGYVNQTNIIQYGVMSGPAWFDETHDLDWFQNAVQTACYNLMYTSPTKIPQTDSGLNQFVTTISGVCDQAVQNGMVAPGTWNAPGFGQLQTGQYLKTGYYVFAQPMALQSQSDREARIAPPIQVAIKLAGAIQQVNVIVSVNR